VSDGIAIGEIALRQGPVDHGNMRAVMILGLVPYASLQQGDPQHCKITWIHQIDRRHLLFHPRFA